MTPANTKSATKRRIKNAIYTALNARRITSRIYRDDYWQGVNDVVDVAKSIAGEAWVSVENGGYDNGGTRKEYKLTAATPEGIEVNGVVVCSAAGSVADPFDAYDIAVILF